MRLTEQQIQQALSESFGLIAPAARRLRCTRQALYRRIQKNRKLQQSIEQARETVLDEAEGQLYKAVCRGEHWAITFLLRTLGRGRGYVERQETVDLSQPPTVRIDVSHIPDEVWEIVEHRAAQQASAASASAEAAPAVYVVDQA